MSEEHNPQAGAADQQAAGPQVAIQKIFAKDISFESPNAPELFNEQYQPEIKINMVSKSRAMDNGLYEVIIQLNVTAASAEKTAFIIEIEYGGIFQIQGADPEQLKFLLGVICPEAIYPFAREAVADISVRGGFPQVMLSLVDFKQLFFQRQAQEGQAPAPADAPASNGDAAGDEPFNFDKASKIDF